MQREPSLLDNVAGVTIMGGAIRSDRRFDLPYAEHNLKSDSDAAAIVIEHPAMKQLVPLDVTTRVVIRQDDVERLIATGSPYLLAVADQVSRYPRFQKTGATYLHDPLAAGLLVQPDLMPLTELHIDVETSSKYSAGATLAKTPTNDNPANALVAIDVDPEPAREALILRMLAAGR
jgi:purine nucleosidase